MKFAITLLISSSFASLAGAITTECAAAVVETQHVNWPSDLSDPSTYQDDFCWTLVSWVVTNCDGTGDTEDQSHADTYKPYNAMCDPDGCDRKFALVKKCTDPLENLASPTIEDVDACCADGVGTLYGEMYATCRSAGTTFLGQDTGAVEWIGEDIETYCTLMNADLNGGGATTAVSGLAIAAAGAAILNVL
jgi:hypothetical protein